MIYADHAATTPLYPEVRKAMEPYLQERFGNPSAQYRFGLECRRAVETARHRIAACLNCWPEEIYFTSGGSEGNTWAVWSGAKQRRCLLTSAVEHHSLLNASRSLTHLGLPVQTLPVDSTGQVLLTKVDRGALVSVQYANNEVGTIQPVEELSHLCRKQGALLHTDAVQAIGHIPVSLDLVDLLTASAHKFGGPKGIGFLYIRKGVTMQPLIYGGSQESGIRGGTENVAAIVGMAEALERTAEGMREHKEQLERMERAFQSTLKAHIKDVRFNGSETKLPGLLSVTIPSRSAEELVYRMDIAGVCLSAGAACDSRGRTEPSHVLTAMGLSASDAASTIRISFGAANRESDGEETARRLIQVLKQS